MRAVFRFCFIVILCWSWISCESPTQPQKNASNEPPVVSFTADKTNLLLGDTLRVTIHASDATLNNGVVDFKDSSIIGFQNLRSVLDTTFIHIYTLSGTFEVTSSFSDGEKSTSVDLSITVTNAAAPIVSLNSYTTPLNMGDTLILSVHASDATLTYGSVDFKDGTIVNFNGLNSVFDTTLRHVYFQPQTFDITASFSDGDKSNEAHLPITVYNPVAPIVSISPSATILMLGDTLRLSLHASDATLANGSVDFNDGTIILLNHLRPVFDTTIVHVYSKVGTFNIAATFSDGYKSTSTQAAISINRHFGPSLTTGMTWQFSYYYYRGGVGSGFAYTRWGTHKWKIISYSIVDQDTSYIVDLVRCDTIHDIQNMYGYPQIPQIDTTYAVNDTIQFTIVSSSSSIQFNWPSAFVSNVVKIMPRYVTSTSDSIQVPGSGIYKDDVGPVKYRSTLFTNSQYVIEELTLIEFIKP